MSLEWQNDFRMFYLCYFSLSKLLYIESSYLGIIVLVSTFHDN